MIEAAREAAESLHREFQARRVVILKLQEGRWEMLAALGLERDRLEDSSVSFTVIDSVVRTGAAELVSDVLEKEGLDGSFSLLMGEVKAFACLPWWAPGPVLAGVLYADTSSRGGFFSIRQMSAAQRAARRLEQAVFGKSNEEATAAPVRVETRRIQPAATPAPSRPPLPITPVPLPDRAVWLRTLALMLESGVILLRGLEVLAETTPPGQHREALRQMSERLAGGQPLYQSLSEPVGYFSRAQIQLIRAAEVSGSLALVLRRLADHEERFDRHRQKLASALVYPLCVVGLSMLMLGTLTPWVLRGQLQLLQQSNQALPWATRLLVGVSQYPLALATAGALLAVVLVRLGRLLWARPATAGWLLKWPVLGRLLRCSAAWRFCESYSMLSEAGVSLPDAVGHAAAISQHPPLLANLDALLDCILSEGWTLSEAMKVHGDLGALLNETLHVGEETGTTPSILRHTASLLQFQFEAELEAWSSMLEPLLVAGAGLFVALVLLVTMAPTISLLQNL